MGTRMGSPGPSSLQRRQKGKAIRRPKLSKRVEGSGGSDGIVLPMEMIATGSYDFAYTIPIQVGVNSPQNMSLQVDTGSSDLWIASTSCSTCSNTNGRSYDPSQAIQTGQNFAINYLEGDVQGPIVWDQVQLGGYSIDNQALAAATTVSSEPLSKDFDGVLGLALPLFSIISTKIPPVTDNRPDGASFSSNLFGITPLNQAPSAHFFSLVLQRPGSDRLPSLLGIGRHPSAVVPDPSKVQYSPLVSDQNGSYLWKADIAAITVYVDGAPKPIALPRGLKGTPFPVAVLDSGVPVIFTTSNIANGIYGALGIGPGADGQYYVKCNTPLNMTITLDSRREITLHPLDLTAEPPDNPNAQYCIGVIQANDSAFSNPASDIGDMILGVPFLRNTYTVLAYQAPLANGGFPQDTDPSDAAPNSQIHPRLGLLGLTNTTIAMEEFHTVRVLGQPLPSAGQPSSGVSTGKKMSVGIDVLLGLVGFFGLCVVLFALRWFLTKRKWNRAKAAEKSLDGKDVAEFGGYQLANRGSRSSMYDPSDSTLRTTRSASSKKRARIESNYTMSSGRTHIEDRDLDVNSELSPRNPKREEPHNVNDPWDPRNYSMAFRDSLFEPDKVYTPPGTPEPAKDSFLVRPDHERTTSELRNSPQAVLLPLLAHTRGESRADDLAEFGLGNLSSMVGVGTAARGSKIDTGFRHSTVGSMASSARSPSPPRRSSLSPRSPRPFSIRSISNPLSSDADAGHGP